MNSVRCMRNRISVGNVNRHLLTKCDLIFLQDWFRFVSLFLKLRSVLVFVRGGLLASDTGGWWESGGSGGAFSLKRFSMRSSGCSGPR